MPYNFKTKRAAIVIFSLCKKNCIITERKSNKIKILYSTHIGS